MAEDKKFADGFYYKPKHEKAPDFVKGSISINIKKSIPWLELMVNKSGYVNLTIKESKNNTHYIELDTWEPGDKKKTFVDHDAIEYPDDNFPNEDVPF